VRLNGSEGLITRVIEIWHCSEKRNAECLICQTTLLLFQIRTLTWFRISFSFQYYYHYYLKKNICFSWVFVYLVCVCVCASFNNIHSCLYGRPLTLLCFLLLNQMLYSKSNIIFIYHTRTNKSQVAAYHQIPTCLLFLFPSLLSFHMVPLISIKND
jgi:hypothetical protein